MTLILHEKYAKSFSAYILFITNRFLRIFPIYWVVLACTALTLLGHGVINSGHSTVVHGIYSYPMTNGSIAFLLFTNVFIFFQDLVMFMGMHPGTGELYLTTNFKEYTPQVNSFLLVPQAWTIAIELMFYLIAPFLTRQKISIIVLVGLASLTIRYVLFKIGLSQDPWSHRFFFSEVVFFVLGILACKVYLSMRNNSIPKYLPPGLFIAIILSVVFFKFFPGPFRAGMLLISVATSLPFIFLMSKDWVWDRKIGNLTYPLYISHILVTHWLSVIDVVEISSLLVLCVSFVFSVILNTLIEERIEKFRLRRLTRANYIA